MKNEPSQTCEGKEAMCVGMGGAMGKPKGRPGESRKHLRHLWSSARTVRGGVAVRRSAQSWLGFQQQERVGKEAGWLPGKCSSSIPAGTTDRVVVPRRFSNGLGSSWSGGFPSLSTECSVGPGPSSDTPGE